MFVISYTTVLFKASKYCLALRHSCRTAEVSLLHMHSRLESIAEHIKMFEKWFYIQYLCLKANLQFLAQFITFLLDLNLTKIKINK